MPAALSQRSIKRHSFGRGIKLNTQKHITEGKPIESPVVSKVVIPVNQHLGIPNQAMVNVGDKVMRGQIIAAVPDAKPLSMSCPVHASISGTVAKIEPRALSNNTNGLCIVIESSPEAGDDVSFMPPLDPFSCSKEEALTRIQAAGITGMGGASFPAHVKLSPPPGKSIDVIIANGCECEPYLTCDEGVIRTKPQELITGLAIAMRIVGVKKAIIGIEETNAELVPLLERAISQNQHIAVHKLQVSVAVCRALYPQGGEKFLITALTGREVPSGKLPMDANAIVQNIQTLVAITEAFTIGKPLIERNLTVSGGACKKPKNLRLPIGALVTDFPPELLAIDNDHLRKIIFGGPMMGHAVDTAAIPVQKNTSGIIFMTGKETRIDAEAACIRCGRCIRNCPCRLNPALMNNALEAQDLTEAVRCGLADCVECGSCSYVCPGRLKLVQRFRVGKQRLRAAQTAQAAQKSGVKN
jgi:electron transport complex protein RnfC